MSDRWTGVSGLELLFPRPYLTELRYLMLPPLHLPTALTLARSAAISGGGAAGKPEPTSRSQALRTIVTRFLAVEGVFGLATLGRQAQFQQFCHMLHICHSFRPRCGLT
jgi:hypothetical protein